MEKQEQKFYTLTQVEKSTELKTVEKGLTEYTEKANALQITNNDNYGNAADFCKDIKTASRKIETKRKFFIDPYKLVINKINSIFKDKVTQLNGLEIIIKKKMIAYSDEQERLAAKERERIEKENQKKLERLAAKKEKHPEKEYRAPVMKEPEIIAQKTARTQNTVSTVRKVKKWKVVEFDKIPKEYLIPDDRKITAIVKAGMSVPGIEVYEESSLAIR